MRLDYKLPDKPMEHVAFSLPEQKDYSYSYGLAYKLACEQLAKVDDVAELCRRSGCSYNTVDSKKIISLEYLNQTYQLTLPGIVITKEGSEEEVPLRDRILIVHYLTQAKGTPISNRLITYKELKEGANYFPTFFKRAVKPLVDCFGKCPEKLLDAARALGGQKASCGDVAVTINAFRRVPITLVLWKGDEEFPPDGNILFDSTILDYLSAEDVNVLCQTIAWELVKFYRSGGDTSEKKC